MRLAVILLVHQNPEQVNIFIRQLLNDLDADIYIHISKKYDEMIRNHLIKDDRIFITKNNIVINWGSDGLTKALLIMLNEVSNSNKHYDYVIVCTGQDLLVRKGLSEYLENHNGQIFLEIRNEPEREAHLKTRLFHTWPDIYTRKYDSKIHPLRLIRSLRYRLIMKGLPIGKKKFSFDVSKLKLYYNYIWCTLPFEVVAYVTNYVNEHPEWMELYTGSLFPAECFLGTIIMQSKYRDRIVFNGFKSKSLTFLKEMDENMHPPILKMGDVKAIEESECFFARKFDVNVDSKIVEHFGDKILNGGDT